MDLSPLEREAIRMLLAGGDAVLDVLRMQYASSSFSYREHSGVGLFVHFSVPPDAPRVDVKQSFTIADVVAMNTSCDSKVDFLGACFSVRIKDGCLDFLEVAAIGTCWPDTAEEELLPHLSYGGHAERDMAKLRRIWTSKGDC